MSAHTRGPWKVSWLPLNPNPRIVSEANGDLIVVVSDGLAFAGETEENARLIAAAPELLAALYEALPYVETALEDKGYKPGAVDRMCATIRAAIARAEGR